MADNNPPPPPPLEETPPPNQGKPSKDIFTALFSKEKGERVALMPWGTIIEWTLVIIVLGGIGAYVLCIPWKASPISIDERFKPECLEVKVPAEQKQTEKSCRVVTTPADKTSEAYRESLRDKEVWSRYEEELAEFKRVRVLNSYFYIGLKVVLIIGGVITPALIAKKDFGNRLAVLFSILTAVSSGLSVEFTFKRQALLADRAITMLANEKTIAITESDSSYSKQLQICQKVKVEANNAAAKSEVKAIEGVAAVQTAFQKFGAKKQNEEPFPCPATYAQIRSNFAYAITQIYDDAVDDNLLFLNKKDNDTAPMSSDMNDGAQKKVKSESSNKK